MAGTVDFKYGTLIRTGPRLQAGGKWDAELNEDVRNGHNNADLTISIRIHFQKIDPANRRAGQYPDTDNKPRRIQRWAPGEFELFKRRLLGRAQRFWNEVYWLKTPATYKELDWPDAIATHRCNLFCRLELGDAQSRDAHYTIAVVRVQNDEQFRSHSRLYSQHDIESESLIPQSTTKF
jgi:hypothetical protein